MGCIDDEGFSAIARDHATNPRNCGPLDNFNGHGRITGPCGDTMEIWLFTQNDRLDQVSFATDGCGPALACGSIATILARGKSIEDAAALRQRDVLDALGGLPPEHEHCALLAADTLRAACNSSAAKSENEEDSEERRELENRLGRIRHKIVVLSGKGGVGKSTVAANLAMALMMSGKQVGLLDIDIHGPSIPTMFGIEGKIVQNGEDGLVPVQSEGLKIMSIGFLLQDRDDAVIWRGPLKMAIIKQFLKDVSWGTLDYLIIDSPPGTGDEPLSVCQLIGDLDGAVIVTTPQKVAAVDVRKSITFCRKLDLPVLGIVENMSGFVCPKCGEVSWIFASGGGMEIAVDMGVPFLGAIPIDPDVASACDSGAAFLRNYAKTPTAKIVWEIARQIFSATDFGESTHPSSPPANPQPISGR